MRARLALSTWVCLLISSGCAKAQVTQINDNPIRIASTSLCGDSYVLDYPPEHVSALSWQSRSSLSLASAPQRALPQARDDAETLLALNPTHVVFGPGEGVKSKAILKAQGIQTVTLDWGENFAIIAKNEAALSGLLGLRLTSATPSITTARQGPKPKVLYLSRSGGTAGAGTFVDAAIVAAGGENFITQDGWLPADPERLITAAPDLIITSYFSDGYESAQSSGLRHASFQKLVERTPSVDIAGALWPCAGPGLHQVTQLISAAIEAL